MEKVRNHVGVALIESESKKAFLLDRYDATYPELELRGAVHFIGGSHDYHRDSSPRDIVEREIREELTVDGNGGFAPYPDIAALRNEILLTLHPYQDFLIQLPSHRVLYSVFIAMLPQKVFDQAYQHLAAGLRLKNEGDAVICSRDEIMQENFRSSGATAHILEEYLHVPVVKPRGINATPLGKPRALLEQYLLDFTYEHPVGMCTG